MPVPAIVLAAGASRRLGRPKQLVEFNGETLLARAVRIAQEAGASPLLVVLGACFDEILASRQCGEAIAVHNEQWEQGIASSIRAGLRALEAAAPSASGVLLMACDQPHLTADHLRALLHVFASKQMSTIAASAYAGVNGVPAIFPRGSFAALGSLAGDQGARALLAATTAPLVAIAFAGGEVDIDLPADLGQLR